MADPIIGEGVRIDGEVSADRDLVVAGEVKGRIRLDHHLTVRAAGSVDAEVDAVRVTILGKAAGSIVASERVEVKPSARVLADVSAPSIVVEEGAVFSGRVQMQLDLPDDA